MKQTFWQRIRIRRRIAIIDEHTLRELHSFRLSVLGITTVLVVMFIITVLVLSLLITHTDLRTLLPGYDENLRQTLLNESMRVDSLSNAVVLQRKYLDVIRDITAGEIKSDTVQSLDSMQLIFQEELMAAKREATEDFVAQYESKEKDNLALFDIQNTAPILTIFVPAHGVITQHYAPRQGMNGVTIQTHDKENICACLAGNIIMVNKEWNDVYTVVIQHANYTSIYRNLNVVTRSVGDQVKAGATIGIVNKDGSLQFELWKEGVSINPEEVIAF